jgi:hypothetical protein
MKRKLEKRIGSLESLRAKLHAKYGADDHLVLELNREIDALRQRRDCMKSARIEPVRSRNTHESHTQL